MQKLLLYFCAILYIQAPPAIAKSQKIGDWKLELSSSVCAMEHDGWGKSISISYVDVPGVVSGAEISFYGIRVKKNVLWGGGSTLIIKAPYSRRKGSFYYHDEGSYEGWGVVSSIDNRGNFKSATLDTLYDFLHVIGGGGRFTLYETHGDKEIVTFTLKGNEEASKAMLKCLSNL